MWRASQRFRDDGLGRRSAGGVYCPHPAPETIPDLLAPVQGRMLKQLLPAVRKHGNLAIRAPGAIGPGWQSAGFAEVQAGRAFAIQRLRATQQMEQDPKQTEQLARTERAAQKTSDPAVSPR